HEGHERGQAPLSVDKGACPLFFSRQLNSLGLPAARPLDNGCPPPQGTALAGACQKRKAPPRGDGASRTTVTQARNSAHGSQADPRRFFLPERRATPWVWTRWAVGLLGFPCRSVPAPLQRKKSPGPGPLGGPVAHSPFLCLPPPRAPGAGGGLYSLSHRRYT